jgi:tetratricopeptide (TPR) repeat protein
MVFIFGMFFLISACRTAKPRDEVLDSTAIQNGVDGADDLQLDIDSGGSSQVLWSPAQRRANASFQYLVALKTILRGDVKAALPILESSYNLDPNSYTGSQLVEARLISGNLAEAEVESNRMVLLYPKDERLRLQYGQVLVFKSDFVGAEIQLKKAIEINPRFEDAHVLLTRVLVTEKKIKAALATIKNFVEKNPASTKGLSLYVRLLFSNKAYKEVLTPAKKLWMLQPGQPESALLYGMALDLNGKSKEAIQLYEQIYRTNPANPELVQRMVALYQEVGNLEDGLNLIDEMIARTSQRHPGLVMQRAILLSELGRNDEASSTLEELLKENPESDRIQFMSGLALEKTGKSDEALLRYDSIAEESPVKIPAFYRKALILQSKGRAEDAEKTVRALTKRGDSDVGTWFFLVELLADAKKYKSAMETATEAAKLYPDKIGMRFLQGVYEERVGLAGEAERSMRAVIKFDPQHAAALNFLGYMLAEQGRDLDEAEKLIVRALALKPEDGSYLDSLGWVFYQRKEYKKALETLQRAHQASPKEGVILEHIGDVFIALKNDKEAVSQFEMALQTELETKDKIRIEKKLEETRRRLQ